MDSCPLVKPRALALNLDAGEEGLGALPPCQNPGNVGRRIEEWIASTLDGTPSLATSALRPNTGGHALFGPRRSMRRGRVDVGWKRIRVDEVRGIAVVLLVDRSIVEDRNIQEIEGALRELIAAGSARVVIDFDLVERCSSRFLATLADLSRRCQAGGGLLKLCGLRNGLDDLFSLLSLRRILPIFPDVPTAVASLWPEQPPASLPVTILATLKGRMGQEPALPMPCPGRLRVLATANANASRRAGGSADDSADTSSTDDQVVRWLIEGQDGHGHGRGPTDIDTPDTFEVGPEESESPEALLELANPFAWDRSSYDEVTGEGGLKCELIEGVLVVTVMMPALADPSSIGLLRDALAQLHERTTHRKVVVSLCNVAFLTSSAVGVLVSHMLQLEWAGGGLRLCHILPPVMAVLKKIHLPMLVETYPTLDDAVLTAWK